MGCILNIQALKDMTVASGCDAASGCGVGVANCFCLGGCVAEQKAKYAWLVEVGTSL